MFEPLRPERNSWTPSWRAAVSEISTMIASTSTCWRRTSSWRISSPRVRWMSGLAEMTMALAPSKRVTTALRAPIGADAGPARRRQRGGRRRGGDRGRQPGVAALAGAAARAGGGRARARAGRLGRRLAEHLLKHRQQLLGVGMLEEDDPDLAAARGAPVELLGDADQLRHRRRRRRGRRSRWSCRPAPPTRPRAPARRARSAISRAPALSSPTIRVTPLSTSIRASTCRTRATLSAKSETTIELRLAVSEPSRLTSGRKRLDRGRGVDMADPEDLGDEAARAGPPAAADRRGRGGARDRLDPKRPARDRHRDEAVGAHRRRGTIRNIRSATAAAGSPPRPGPGPPDR